ncbi:Peroxisome biosynthesis protein PAS1 [Frankliniella fusca]|uniref:Peroxisome biosynthesis protein PAS1 n=1 Tax=Frankliniella fusca TaxID=407009 RepID=A0AAE1HEV4_9NEOP|nr:Peroxisome biosynthesis protein PAS1 [Frankliniella fusca]
MGKSRWSAYRLKRRKRQNRIRNERCTCSCPVHRKRSSPASSSSSDIASQGVASSYMDNPWNESPQSHTSSQSDVYTVSGGAAKSTFSEENLSDSMNEYEAHYLEEGDHDDTDTAEEVNLSDEDGHEDFGNGNHPNDPEDDPGDDDADADVEEDENATNFGLNHPRLNVICRMHEAITMREIIILVLMLSVQHSLTYAAIVDVLKVLNVILGRKYLPESKQTLWKLLGKDRTGITKYFYCAHCKAKGSMANRPLFFRPYDNSSPPLSSSGILLKIVMSRLKYVLETPGFADNLRYREERVKIHEENIEDILDGTRYRSLSEPGNVLSNANNFSYGMNNDGFRITRTSNAEAQPIYIKLNELSPSVRQKHIFLSGIWIDRTTPNMNCLLAPIVEQANDLAINGLQWRRNDENITSKFVELYCTADAKAKALLLNLNEPTGFRSCLFCDIVGVQANGVKFPMWPFGDMPEPTPRTHDTILRDMIAEDNGFNGSSELGLLEFMDLKEGFSCDDLHPIYVGVVKDYFEELFLPEGAYYIRPGNLAILNRRWLAVKFPTCLARKPRKIATFKRWRGSEFRNFLLYGLPCLAGLVTDNIFDNLQRLSNAAFLLSKQSISEDDLIQAEEDLSVFCYEFQDLFGVAKMKFNVHVLTHLTEVVRSLGNLYVHSTFNFESWNHRLKKLVTSSWGTCDQVVFRLLIATFVSAARFDNRISDRVRLSMESIILKSRLDNALHIGPVYLLGKVNRRPPTAGELQLLGAQGIILDSDIVLEYKRAYCNNFEWRSTQYTREGRSDNTNIQTGDGSFASIKNILVITTNGDRVCGLVCHIYDLLEHVPLLKFMYPIPPQEENLQWIPASSVSCLAVKIVTPLSSVIAPIANNVEID